jgi:hypothetical protein
VARSIRQQDDHSDQRCSLFASTLFPSVHCDADLCTRSHGADNVVDCNVVGVIQKWSFNTTPTRRNSSQRGKSSGQLWSFQARQRRQADVKELCQLSVEGFLLLGSYDVRCDSPLCRVACIFIGYAQQSPANSQFENKDKILLWFVLVDAICETSKTLCSCSCALCSFLHVHDESSR